MIARDGQSMNTPLGGPLGKSWTGQEKELIRDQEFRSYTSTGSCARISGRNGQGTHAAARVSALMKDLADTL